MNVTREPLPYPHRPHDEPPACAQGEGAFVWNAAIRTCPGCLAAAMASAIHDPRDLVWLDSLELVPAVEALRRVSDDFDPMRVLFERALAERGIA